MTAPSVQSPEPSPVARLIQRHAGSGDTGCLELIKGLQKGFIYFQDHCLVQAQLGEKKGLAPLYELMQWDVPYHEWHAHRAPHAAGFSLTLEDLQSAEPLEEIESATNGEEPPPDLVEEEVSVDGSMMMAESEPEETPADLYHQETDSGLLIQYIISLDWNDAPGGPLNLRFEGTDQSGCVIGSGEDCQFILAHPSVEPLHCSLMIHSDHVELWDLGTAEKTRVNGAVVEQAVLNSGDLLQLGEVPLRFSLRMRRKFMTGGNQAAPSPAAAPAAPAPAKGRIPKTAIHYSQMGGPAPKPGVVKALRRLFFRTTNRVRYTPK